MGRGQPHQPLNIVGFYQQDRYSNGGAKGNVAAVSMNGGLTWRQVAAERHPVYRWFLPAARTRGSRSARTGRCTP